jgi:quercetin dioxygenase-like cupin family protein
MRAVVFDGNNRNVEGSAMSLNLSHEGPIYARGSRMWMHAVGLGAAVALGIALGGMGAWQGVGAAPATFPIEHHVLQASAEEPASAARPRSIQHPIACEKLPNVPGKSITTVLVEFPPNALTPSHRHPGSVTAYVLKGALRSQLDGGPVETFGVGGTWFEPPGTVHNMVENASGTESAELLATFVADSDCGPLTIFDR